MVNRLKSAIAVVLIFTAAAFGSAIASAESLIQEGRDRAGSGGVSDPALSQPRSAKGVAVPGVVRTRCTSHACMRAHHTEK